MKPTQWVMSLQVFGLIVHLFLIAALIAIGFFDCLGIESQATSSAHLLHKFATSQSPIGAIDVLITRIADETINAASMLLSVMKMLSVSAMISFVAHAISFRRKCQDQSK